MQQFHRILIGIDALAGDGELTPPNRAAFERALWVAERVSGTIHIQSVFDVSQSAQDAFGTSEAGQHVRQILDGLLKEAESRGVSAVTEIAFGRAAVTLIESVNQGGFELLVIGTRDLGRAARLLYGSTALKVLRHCPCPVWVVRPNVDWDEPEILVATNLHDSSQDLLELAVSTAQLMGGKLRVIHTIEQSLERRMVHTGLTEDKVQALRQKDHAEAERILHEQLARTDYRTLPHGVLVEVCHGHPDNVILNRIEQHAIDLLIMGTAGRTGLAGLTIGNTAEQLLPQLPCSVLAVKPCVNAQD